MEMSIKEKVLIGLLLLGSCILWGSFLWIKFAPEENYISKWRQEQVVSEVKEVKAKISHQKITDMQKCMEEYLFDYCLDKVK